MFCEKCHHTGLLPYVMSNGKIAKHAFLHCECNQPEKERYQPLKPDDFDFPCSRDFRRYYEIEGGGPDLGPTEPTQLESPLKQEKPLPEKRLVTEKQIAPTYFGGI